MSVAEIHLRCGVLASHQYVQHCGSPQVLLMPDLPLGFGLCGIGMSDHHYVTLGHQLGHSTQSSISAGVYPFLSVLINPHVQRDAQVVRPY